MILDQVLLLGPRRGVILVHEVPLYTLMQFRATYITGRLALRREASLHADEAKSDLTLPARPDTRNLMHETRYPKPDTRNRALGTETSLLPTEVESDSRSLFEIRNSKPGF